MREIKYRGKRIDNSEWVYGYYWRNRPFNWAEPKEDTTQHYIRVQNNEDCSLTVQNDYVIIPATVGEFTGLKDKKGKEIYEDDITISCAGYNRTVVWKNNSWQYYWRVKKPYPGESSIEEMFNPIVSPSDKRFGDEVIDNIHDIQI